jgi:hypothetical protein
MSSPRIKVDDITGIRLVYLTVVDKFRLALYLIGYLKTFILV